MIDWIGGLVNRFSLWATNPKTTATVAGSTTTVGLGEVFQWIPSDIGRLAALGGFILTCILIYVNILAARKTQLELDELKRRDDDRKKRARQVGVSIDDH